MLKKQKLYVSILCGLLVLLFVVPILMQIIGFVTVGAVSQSEIDNLKNQKLEVAAKKEAIQGDIDVLVEEQASVMEQKEALDLQNELTRQEIEIINEEIDLFILAIEAKEIELEAAVDTEETQKTRFRTRVRAMEETGVVDYLSCLFKATSFSELLTRINEISMVLEYDKTLEDEYIKARENVEVLKSEYEGIKEEQEIVFQELEAKKAQLEADIETANVLIQQLEEEIKTNKEKYLEVLAQEKAFQAEINNKIAELQRQEEEAKKAAEADGGTYTGPEGSTGVYRWPIPGKTPGSAFGWRMHPIAQEMRFHAGEDIAANSGTSILAADGGTVATAAYSSSYGNYVMINHGGGRVTLYAHMSSMAVSFGQSVTKGQVIGYVGSTGLSTGPHLHFEVRVNGAATDPKQYFGGNYN